KLDVVMMTNPVDVDKAAELGATFGDAYLGLYKQRGGELVPAFNALGDPDERSTITLFRRAGVFQRVFAIRSDIVSGHQANGLDGGYPPKTGEMGTMRRRLVEALQKQPGLKLAHGFLTHYAANWILYSPVEVGLGLLPGESWVPSSWSDLSPEDT